MNKLYTNKNESVFTFVFVCALIVLLILITASYLNSKANLQSENKMLQSYNAHLTIMELISNINESEIRQRDFIALNDSLTLANYNLAVIKLQNSYNTLDTQLKENSSQEKDLKILKIYIDQKFELLHQPIDSNRIQKFIIKCRQNNKVLKALLLHVNMLKGKEIFSLSVIQANHIKKRSLSPIFFLWTALFSVLMVSSAYWKIQSGYKKLKQINNRLIINKKIHEYSEEIGQLSHFYKSIESDKTFFSKNGYKMLANSIEEFSHFSNFIEFVHPDDRQLLENVRQKIIQDEDSVAYYFRIVKKDGELRYIKATEKVISDLFEKKISIGIYLDITDELKKAKELEEKIFDLEISNKELSAFNYVASHDLQEPMRKVQLFISKIRTGHFDSFPSDLKQSFLRIEVAANKMEKLINDLLLFSHSNKLNKEFERTDLNEILKNTIQDFDELMKEKRTDISGGILPTIEAIPFQIQQLFNNIIGNSLKYAKENIPLKISISTKIVAGDEIPKLRNKTLKYYQISFADNGIGFDQQYAESIFTIFSRLHDDSHYTGTGIGLAICKKIVDNHKGTISAEGINGGGAVFNVFFPV